MTERQLWHVDSVTHRHVNFILQLQQPILRASISPSQAAMCVLDCAVVAAIPQSMQHRGPHYSTQCCLKLPSPELPNAMLLSGQVAPPTDTVQPRHTGI
jgi:hypothetical protein